MIYYRLATVFGYLLMGMAAVSFVVYLALLVGIASYMGDGIPFKVTAGCFVGGVLLFQTRSLIVDFLAERVAKHGLHTSGRVVALEHCGELDMDEKGFGDWYQLIVHVAPVPGMARGRDAYIEQLFKKSAAAWLAVGATVPIRYAPELELAMVEHADAYPRLHSGPQFGWRRNRE
ncbi:hypothetical protein [Bordetella sp. 2513F-2]